MIEMTTCKRGVIIVSTLIILLCKMQNVYGEVSHSAKPPIACMVRTADITVPLIFHIFHKSDNTGKLTVSQIENQVDIINDVYNTYNTTGIDFFIAAIIYHENDDLHSMSTGVPDPDYYDYMIDDGRAINIIVGDLPSGSWGYSVIHDHSVNNPMIKIDYYTVPGDGLYPPSGDGGITAAHELGHFFGLYHTYFNAQASCTKTNTEGDLMYPFGNDGDPYTGAHWRDPTYVNTCPDPASNTCYVDIEGGDMPDPVDNILSLFSDSCRDHFTPFQINKMDSMSSLYLPDIGTRNGYLEVASVDISDDDETELYVYVDTLGIDGSFVLNDGTIFNLADDTSVIVDAAVDIGDISGDPIIFQKKDAGSWETVELRANGNSFDNVIFDGGTFNVTVASDNNVFNQIISRNGLIGFDSEDNYYGGANSSFEIIDSVIEDNTGIGVIAHETDFEITGTTIQDNAGGLTVTYSESIAFEQNTIESNGTGIFVGVSGDFDISDDGYNYIINNDHDEIEAVSNGMIFAGDANAGNNNIYDSSDPGTTFDYIDNKSSYSIKAEDNWWGTSSPTSAMFDGAVDYNPSLGSEATLRVVGSDLPLGDRIAQLQDLIYNRSAEVTASDINQLYYLQKSNKGDVYRQSSLTMNAIRQMSKSRLESGKVVREYDEEAVERAMLSEIHYAVSEEQYEEAFQLLRQYGPFIAVVSNVAEYRLLLIRVLEYYGQFDEALTQLYTVRKMANIPDNSQIMYDIIEQKLGRRRGIRHETSLNDELLISISQIRPGIANSLFDRHAQSENKNVNYENRLLSPYPNPFNPSTVIPYYLGELSEVEIAVYDPLGRRVSLLAAGRKEAGTYRVTFDASSMPSGVYFVRAYFITSSGKYDQFSQRIVLQK